jgi:hypothetical protein
MKKLLLTISLGFCMGSAVMAQAPAKASAKKKTAAITIVPATTVAESNAEMKTREEAKKKHYEALKAGKTEDASTAVPQNDQTGARKKKTN